MTLDVTKGWDYALVHTDNGVIPLHRLEDAQALAAALREAAEHLETVRMREAARLDHKVCGEHALSDGAA